MREILFRGKRKDNGKWIEGGCSERDGKVFIVTWVRYVPDTRDWDTVEYYENNPHYNSTLIEVIPETVCQYTGLTDKNGRKIFEGDIVREESSFDEEPFIHTIVYSEKHKTFTTDIQIYGSLDEPLSEYLNFDECEVIGDIFDNPETVKSDAST